MEPEGQGERTLWFGFSPALVIALLLIPFGGLAVAAVRPASYEDGIAVLCAEVNDAQQGPPPANLWDSAIGMSELRTKRLNALSPGPDRAAVHAALLSGEQQIVAKGREGDALRTAFLASRRRVPLSERLLELMTLWQQQDARYSALGAEKGCAD